MHLTSIVLLLLIAEIAGSQTTFAGKFEAKAGYIHFLSDSTLEFKTLYGCCILTEVYGYGKYEVLKDKIRVETLSHECDCDSYYEFVSEADQADKIEIISATEPIGNCSVILKDRVTNKPLAHPPVITRDTVIFKNISQSTIDYGFIEIRLLGFEKLEIPLAEAAGKSIKITLGSCQMIKDKTVYFSIFSDTSGLQLIGPKIIEDYVRKNEIRRKMRIVFTAWPWKWKKYFRIRHSAIPTTFLKITETKQP